VHNHAGTYVGSRGFGRKDLRVDWGRKEVEEGGGFGDRAVRPVGRVERAPEGCAKKLVRRFRAGRAARDCWVPATRGGRAYAGCLLRAALLGGSGLEWTGSEKLSGRAALSSSSPDEREEAWGMSREPGDGIVPC
jgi:hypothetical protein